jgi:dihydrofolate reductase
MSEIQIALVVAAGRNGVIGRDGDLPWRLSSDLKRFRALTLGKPVLMGRKTFQSIGRPLDGRPNIVVTRDPDFGPEGVEVAGTLEDGLALARSAAHRIEADSVMVIGGAQVYDQLRGQADVIHLTRVDLAPDGEALFAEPDDAEWRMSEQEHVKAGPKDDADFVVETYVRRH